MKKFFTSPVLHFTFSILLFTSYIYSQPANWTIKGIGGGGAFFSPSINPANSNEYYIATDIERIIPHNKFRSVIY